MDEALSSPCCQRMENNRCGWTYFVHNEGILSWAKQRVFAEGLLGVEVPIAQIMSRFLGEIESVSSTAQMTSLLDSGCIDPP